MRFVLSSNIGFLEVVFLFPLGSLAASCRGLGALGSLLYSLVHLASISIFVPLPLPVPLPLYTPVSPVFMLPPSN